MKSRKGACSKVITVLLGLLIISMVTVCSSALEDMGIERPFTYHEFDGIHLFYKTNDIKTYRELLPDVFDMPDEPLVWVFVTDYYKMDKATEPYKEAALYLLSKYEGKKAWHCLTMPVTTEAARYGGVEYLGFPKIIGDISFERNEPGYKGILKLNNQTVMTLHHDTQGRAVTAQEEERFKEFAGIPSLNILKGSIYEVKFGGKANLLETSRAYPDKFIVKVGKADLSVDLKAAGAYSERMAKIYSITPSEHVLAYYLQNKFKLNFRR